MNCPNCGAETEGKFCTNCGASLSNVNPANSLNEEKNNIPEASEINNNNNPNEQQQQYNQNNTPQYTDNYNQANYNQNSPQYTDNYNQPNNQNRPLNQKSKAVGIILNIILPGLGYAYVGKWGEGIVIFVVYMLCWIFGFALIIPWIIAIILWIYTLIKTNEMIDKYNAGLPY